MKQLVKVLAVCVGMFSQQVVADGDIFDELERETGGCEIALKSKLAEISKLRKQASKAEALASQLELLQTRLQTSGDKIAALEAENTQLYSSVKDQNSSVKDQAQLILKLASLSGELEATKSALAAANGEKALLVQQLADLKQQPAVANTVPAIEPVPPKPTTVKLASPLKSTLPPKYVGPLEVTVNNCSQKGPIMFCSMNLKSIDGFVDMKSWLPHSSFSDGNGNTYKLAYMEIGDQVAKGSSSIRYRFTEGLVTKADMKFYGVAPNTQKIDKLSVFFNLSSNNGTLTFKNIPLVSSVAQ